MNHSDITKGANGVHWGDKNAVTCNYKADRKFGRFAK